MKCESSPLLWVIPRIWKIEIRDKKCVALLQGSEMLVRLHFMSLILGFWSCGMAAVTVYL